MEDETLLGQHHGFLRPDENIVLNYFNILGAWVLVYPAIFMGTMVNGDHIANDSCCSHCFIGDVMP